MPVTPVHDLVRLRRRIVISILLSLLISFVVVAIFFKPRDFAKILHLSPWVIVQSLLLVLLSLTAGGLRLWRLTRMNGHPSHIFSTIRAHTLGLFSAAITPSGSGNFPAVALSLQVDGYPAMQAWGLALYISVVDVFFFTWAIPLSYLFLWSQNYIPALPWLHAALLAIFALFVVLSIMMLRYSRYLMRFSYRVLSISWFIRFRRPVYRFLHDFMGRLQTMVRSPWQAQLELQCSTAVMHGSMFVVFWVLARHFSLEMPFANILALFTLLLALSLFVPTPGGSGFFEAALALSFRQEQALIAPVVVLWRLLSFYSVFLIAPLFGIGVMTRVLLGATQRHHGVDKQST